MAEMEQVDPEPELPDIVPDPLAIPHNTHGGHIHIQSQLYLIGIDAFYGYMYRVVLPGQNLFVLKFHLGYNQNQLLLTVFLNIVAVMIYFNY
jgi:hypothetical protein